MMKVAFYAPIKPPDHHIPSGDRLIARNLVSALEVAGHEVELASRFIAYSKRADEAILAERKKDALTEAELVTDHLTTAPPDCWITYHPYCKAPDWIGPFVCGCLKIPYITVEAARTGQGFENGSDLWKDWRAEAQAGIRAADLHLSFKPADRGYLHSLGIDNTHIRMIPPFINMDELNFNAGQGGFSAQMGRINTPKHWRSDWPVLMTAGMMRPGKKVENYRLIAEAVTGLRALQWNFVVVGGGPEEENTQNFFKDIDPNRMYFSGAVDHPAVLSWMKASDIFVWPGWKEPIGMVYLEAQLCGLPVCALDSMGVSLTVRHGKTGLLSPENNPGRFRDNLAELISHPDLRRDLAAAAPKHVAKNHSLSTASAAIDAALRHRLGLA
ncbi:MAG: glycosyltransferase family 4 protein [Rhizobiaceae bacterium]